MKCEQILMLIFLISIARETSFGCILLFSSYLSVDIYLPLLLSN